METDNTKWCLWYDAERNEAEDCKTAYDSREEAVEAGKAWVRERPPGSAWWQVTHRPTGLTDYFRPRVGRWTLSEDGKLIPCDDTAKQHEVEKPADERFAEDSPLSHRYLVFTYSGYDACGGWYDLQGGFDKRNDAVKAAKERCEAEEYTSPTWHVVDTTIPEVVNERECTGEWAYDEDRNWLPVNASAKAHKELGFSPKCDARIAELVAEGWPA